MASDPLLESLRAAVDAAPDDIALRLHLAEMLVATGQHDEAVRQAGAVLQLDPANIDAVRLVSSRAPDRGDSPDFSTSDGAEEDIVRGLDEQLDGVVPPMFVEGDDSSAEGAVDVDLPDVRLVDVGGMEELKARLEAAVLAPMRNPELGRLYSRSGRGGLLMYGPPGCGKTFIARALAGEIGARFLAVSLVDVLDMFIGQSERNLHEIFDTARRNAPCVVFLDELDALGRKRSHMRNNAARSTVNQLLEEMDGARQGNSGVFVLGATNHPWDVDTALRRPGRFDRMVLVLPPDEPARREIFRLHLRDRPVAQIDLRELARATDNHSGADIAYVCDLAAEQALLDSVRSGTPRLIEMRDLREALGSVKPSINPWIEAARSVAQFANEGGTYDELLEYLRKRKLV